MNVPAGTRIFLDDHQSGKSCEITTSLRYSFTAGAESYERRFVLRFEPAGKPATALAAAPERGGLTTYPNPGTAGSELRFSADALQGRLATATLLDAFGRVVATRELAVQEGVAAGSFSGLGLKPGIYLLRLQAQNDVSTRRIELR